MHGCLCMSGTAAFFHCDTVMVRMDSPSVVMLYATQRRVCGCSVRSISPNSCTLR